MTKVDDLKLDSIVLSGIRYEGPITVFLDRYLSVDGNIAIRLDTEEGGWSERLASVTINIFAEDPAPGCIWVKNWSENEGMLDALTEAGWLEGTGRTTRSGFVTVPEARLTGPLAAAVEEYLR